MARRTWEELLPSGSTGSASRSEQLGQLVSSTGTSNSAESSTSLLSSLLPSGNTDVTEQLTSLTTQISSLASVQQAQVSALQDNTQAVSQNTSSKSSGEASIGSTVESAASSFLGGGLSSLSPLISGILSLFGGSSQTAAAPSPFLLPAPVQSEAGVTGNAPGQVVPVSFGENGQPRAESTGAMQQVTIQVNAMDSQSFLDHSDEIASAVKQAILNSSSLNDVISSL